MTQGIVGAAIGTIAAARWHLPVRTPSDQAAADRAETAALDAGWQLIDRTLPDPPRRSLDHLIEAGQAGQVRLALLGQDRPGSPAGAVQEHAQPRPAGDAR